MSDRGQQTENYTAQVADEGFLRRWSRRKQQDAEGQLVEDEPASEQTPAHLPEAQESQPVLTDADMPAIESLDDDSDFSGFMSPGVSDQLRNLALRKLFQIPSFNIRDGLDDYDGDYTSFLKLGDAITCDMKHMMEVEARKEAEKLLAQQESNTQQESASMQSSASAADERAENTETEEIDFEDDECCEDIDDVENMG